MLSSIEQSIKTKVEQMGKPLKDWDVSINYGIKTGYNEAFIIDALTREALIEKSPKAAEIIRPILRGRDIEKYKANWEELYLIFLPWHFPLHFDSKITGVSLKAEKLFKQDYPSVYEWMLKHKKALSDRNKSETGIRYEWYALQRWGANYMEDFSRPKIVWKRVGSIVRFAYDETGCFCLDSTCFATGQNLKFIVGYLNSKVSRMLLLNNAPKTGTGDIITSVQALEPLLVPKVSKHTEVEIGKLVDKANKMLNANINADTQSIEIEIDNLIYQAFQFNEDEVLYIRQKSIP